MRETGKSPQSFRLNLQHVLIGAALGLYYGITYKGTTIEANYVYVLIWSLIAAIVTVIIKSIRTKPSFKEMVIDFIKMSLLYAVFLVGLEFRKQVELWGGKAGVIVFTTSLGAFVGLVLGLQKKAGFHPTEKNNKGG